MRSIIRKKHSKLLLLLAIALLSFALIAFLLRPFNGNDEQNVVFLVIDGLGAPYLHNLAGKPVLFDGTVLEEIKFSFLEPFAESTVFAVHPFPETTAAHALFYIAGDCDREWNSIKNCVSHHGITTFCDYYRQKGYLCIMVSQAGDFKEARANFDVVLHDAGEFDYRVELNSRQRKAIETASFLEKWAEKANDYRREELDVNYYIDYSAHVIETVHSLTDFLSESFPEQKYFIFSNARGADLCGHRRSPSEYIECVKGIEPFLEKLALNLVDSNTLFVLTSDHGMAFACPDCKGRHASRPYSITNEAVLVPFIVFEEDLVLSSGKAYDIMPTVFELSGFPNACEKMRYCKGHSLVKAG